ncbi:RanBPM [Purpureocillium lilacinum]|uniref:RanBPM n=1 Tax=Purpureocillium lilacinum TaxID=33203 RepID=A0A179GZ47_PURLI|nr:RanBPM [Purpureocillium lilacinum]OAQ82728.1 RanBPM [Purpureocillium lilacinum]
MTSPFRHGSSGFPDSDSSSGTTGQTSRSRRASPYNNAPAAPPRGGGSHSSNFYTHPSRTSLLSPSGDLLVEPVPSLARPPTHDTAVMDEQAGDGMANVWNAAGPLPSFSRAFDMFTTPRDADGFGHGAFVPSYLRGSTYMRLLEEQRKAQSQSAKESKRSTDNGANVDSNGFVRPPLPSGAHRGMTHNVIERPPPFEEDEAVPPLPTRWNKDDAGHGAEVQSNPLTVRYVGSKNHHEREYEAGGVRANHHMPPECGIYYFEVQIVYGKRDDTTISIGFSARNTALSRAVGWEPESWGYHGDDGRTYTGQNIGRNYGPTFSLGDVIGCGVNFRDHTAFFTKNGVKLGTAFTDVVRSKLYPTVSMKKTGEQVTANFGQCPFVYNIDDMIREQREKIQLEIAATDTSRLEPGMNGTDLIQTLVLQFLQHDGYVETARAFAEDIKAQKEALNLDPNVKVDGINIKDDEDANNRQRIRRAILEGDIDRALKHTNAFYPQVLQDNEEVYFKLRCRKFIEMVRKAAQIRTGGGESKRSNGHGPTSGSQDMDLDLNGNDGVSLVDNMDMDGSEQQMELMQLEQSMLEYGQALGAEYANDSRKEISNALSEIWSLVAYSNPLKEPQVSHLMDRKGRSLVAEELNSAILSSLGKSSRAALEKIYAQTSVLLDELRQDGGPGAFVSLQSILEDITTFPQI